MGQQRELLSRPAVPLRRLDTLGAARACADGGDAARARGPDGAHAASALCARAARALPRRAQRGGARAGTARADLLWPPRRPARGRGVLPEGARDHQRHLRRDCARRLFAGHRGRASPRPDTRERAPVRAAHARARARERRAQAAPLAARRSARRLGARLHLLGRAVGRAAAARRHRHAVGAAGRAAHAALPPAGGGACAQVGARHGDALLQPSAPRTRAASAAQLGGARTRRAGAGGAGTALPGEHRRA
mmetsp:Transcript_31664/g.73798  ORF Transcript_31664/g.73798 Transcript_31664/m.73798 type:complete len:250 (+) Transcript_31664:853-1602(+)